MNSFENFLGKYRDDFYALMRIVIAILFASHGAQKLFGVLGGHKFSDPLFITAGIIEFFGGILIGLGLKTSIVAFIASGEMAVAYFKVHAWNNFWPVENGGEKAVFYCFLFLFMSAYGSGSFSLDKLLANKSSKT
jgi:putative oxidoreductase